MYTIVMTDKVASLVNNTTKMNLCYIKITDSDTTKSIINKLTIQFMKSMREGKIKLFCDVGETIEQISKAEIKVE